VEFDWGSAFALRELTDLHSVELMLSEFVPPGTHELRTPLAAISGACDTLLRSEITISDATRDQLMQMISMQSNRLATIVNDILIASRLDSGMMRLQLQPTDAIQIAEQVIEASRMRAPEGVTVQLEAPEMLPDVMADPELLYTVLNNLVDNAIKYSPDGGDVRVTLAPRVNRMRISVADHGIGISAADIEKIFLKFFRVDAAMISGASGTGLGLYICRELVEQMNGELWAESNGLAGPEHGSTFHVDLAMATSVVDAMNVKLGDQAARS
jgi:two-component system phosphate regulon sensor histidine kinase PhoR